MREQTAGVKNAGVSPMDSQPENKSRWHIQICYLKIALLVSHRISQLAQFDATEPQLG